MRWSTALLVCTKLLLSKPFHSQALNLSPALSMSRQPLSFISADAAKIVDEMLMKQPGFSLDQLMELAGLSVATAAHNFIESQMSMEKQQRLSNKILVICGPGNNGGDGLVAARHLFHFGYNPSVLYPKKNKLFSGLVAQCDDLGIEVIESPTTASVPADSDLSIDNYINSYDIIVDAIFGFSFKGPIRSPYTEIIQALAHGNRPVVAVDVPSGWNVDTGDETGTGFYPRAVVSLSYPKLCMKGYKGVHYLGGRFMPPKLAQSLGLSIPNYGRGSEQIVRIIDDELFIPSSSSSSSCVQATEGAAVAAEQPDISPVNALLISRDSTPSTILPQPQTQFQLPSQPQPQLAVMFATAENDEQAKTIARGLLQKQLVACVNIVPAITSMYVWEGKMEESSEVLLIIKTRLSLLQAVTNAIKSLHSYTIPESIALGILGGNRDYLNWVVDSTKSAVP